MPTDTQPFYRHILGTHWKDKPNKGLDVKVKKKSAIFFESQAASHNRAAVSLNSGTGSAETSQTGALHSQGNRFAVVPSQCMGVHVNGSSRHIDTASLPAVHQTRLAGATRKTSEQWSVREYPCRKGKSALKGSSIRARPLPSGLTCIQWLQQRSVGSNIEENCAGVATRLRATDEGGKVKSYYITQDSHNARHT